MVLTRYVKCFVLIATTFNFLRVVSECPNACSQNGVCTINDECICYKNWIGNDCSLRLCQYGLAHVDLPLSGLHKLSNITLQRNEFIYNMFFPYGRNSEFPLVIGPELVNNTLQESVLLNTGHAYVECSNKGTCDRNQGACQCISGFEGSACQRNSCPKLGDNPCNSHGRCVSARYMAYADNQNIYNLWDADINIACKCDHGYYGAVCEQRTCKVGYDPLYFDLNTNNPVFETSRRYSNWTIVIATFNNLAISGNYSIRFFDYNGKGWLSPPIQYNASCFEITNALESLPNAAIKKGSVGCLKWNTITPSNSPQNNFGFPASFMNLHKILKYTLTFPNNPGRLRQIELKVKQSVRPTLLASNYRTNSNADLKTFVYPDGFSGEYLEYFTSKCQQVDVTIQDSGTFHYLGGLTDFETRLLQRCLGKSDREATYSAPTNKVLGKVYKWDYGTIYNPHLIRLVPKNPSGSINDTMTDVCPGVNNSIRGTGVFCPDPYPFSPGFFAPLIYDQILEIFVLMIRPADNYSPSNTVFTVFTTDGVAQMVNDNTTVYTDPNFPYSKTVYTKPNRPSAVVITNNTFYVGNLDCVSTSANLNGANDCVEKGKMVFIIDPYNPLNNPKYMNMYVVNNIKTINRYTYVPSRDIPSITLDMSVNAFWDSNTMKARIYTFTPQSSYNYATPCGNRGLCDADTGLCNCFLGYYGDDCGVQDNSLSYLYI